jgi:hypothetical protein
MIDTGWATYFLCKFAFWVLGITPWEPLCCLLLYRCLGGKMSSLLEDRAFLLNFVRKLRGGSQPVLAEASDGRLYVVKFTNNPQGPNLPFNESIGTELYRRAHLAVPPWRTLRVNRAFIEENPSCWFETPKGRLRPQEGVCFASLYLGSENSRILEMLPKSSFKRVRNLDDFWLAWFIDICAHHADPRQAIFYPTIRNEHNAIFIDHGHMFGGPNGDQHVPIEASRYLDRRIYPCIGDDEVKRLSRKALGLDHDRIWRDAQILPVEWRTESALGRFWQCLTFLSSVRTVENVFKTLLNAHLESNVSSEYGGQWARKPVLSVLRAGIQESACRTPIRA